MILLLLLAPLAVVSLFSFWGRGLWGRGRWMGPMGFHHSIHHHHHHGRGRR
jgi:hypothetical protein